VLVHLRRGASSASAKDVAADAGVKASRFISSVGVAVVDTNGRRSSDVAAELRSDPRVELVEPNRMRYAAGDPNDPLFFDQTHLFNSRLPAAWDVTHGSPSTVIAVLDSGIDANHPDLVGRIVAGRDIVNNDATPTDDNGHGTAVAGVAAADSDNNIGVAGSAWDAKIMPVKVLGADGAGSDADIASGIEWAVDAGAKILNMSLGGPGSSATLANAVNYATSNGVLMVAASGNESTDVPSFPAAYDAVVAVGATDWYGDVAAFSNRGPHVDLVAQGVGMVTTASESLPSTEDDYASFAGTSFSAPLVAGVAALVKAKNPTFTPAQIASRLRSTAIDRGPSGIDDHYGWGLLDAYAAVGGKTAGFPPQAVRDDEEPNDTAASAGAIAVEQTSTISPEGDLDWFYVDAPQAGTITVTVTPPAADDGQGVLTFDPLITAWSPTFVSMGAFDASGGGAPEIAALQVADAGRYRFRVSNFATSRSTGGLHAPDAYSISSGFVPAAVEATFDDPLWVKDVSPAPFSRNAAASVQPVVTLTQTVTEASAESSSNVKLIDAKTGSALSASRTYDNAAKTVTIAPSASLVVGRSYMIRVTGITDGETSMSDTFTSHFTVTPPTFPDDLVADFNKDGFEDVAIGVPGEDIAGKVDGGAVHVLYGSASGVSGSGSQFWHQDSSGIAGGIETGDRFGEALATGDLNKDGYDDLVVGAPYEDLGAGQANAGAFHVIFGSATKLRSTNSQLWTQDSSGIPNGAEANDRFGSSFAIGSFDASSGNDIVVGSPGEGVGSAANAGAVHVIRGSASGLVSTGAQLWTQDSAGISFFAEAGDGFGSSLAAGDFERDGHDDVAIGAPSDNVVDVDEGSVTLMRGSIVGLKPAGVVGEFANGNEPEADDGFGASVAIADVGGYSSADGYADLIVGVPGQDALLAPDSGRFDVVSSDHSGPWFFVQSIDQSSLEMGSRESDGLFSASLDARTFGSRGVIAAGSPFDDVTELTDAGSVHIYESGAPIEDGFVGLGAVNVYTQDTPGIPDVAESDDFFAADSALLDVDGDGLADIAVASPGESVGPFARAGAVVVERDVTADDPSASMLTQNSTNITGSAEANDRFGASLGS
jgi:hypothetical protein